MRHCINDTPEVFEDEDFNLATLLTRVADQIDACSDDSTWFNLTVNTDTGESGDQQYRATLYAH